MRSGLTPIPQSIADKCVSAEGLVEVRYRHSYRCVQCGWEPSGHFGSLPAMEKHLREQHGYQGKMLWIDGYSSDQIKQAVDSMPDLVSACKAALERMQFNNRFPEIQERLAAALAKADEHSS